MLPFLYFKVCRGVSVAGQDIEPACYSIKAGAPSGAFDKEYKRWPLSASKCTSSSAKAANCTEVVRPEGPINVMSTTPELRE